MYRKDKFAIPQTVKPGMQFMVVDLGGKSVEKIKKNIDKIIEKLIN